MKKEKDEKDEAFEKATRIIELIISAAAVIGSIIVAIIKG